MKTRKSYVSNSSSSSFLVPRKPEGGINAIRLPREIWEAISDNHIDWNGEKYNLHVSDEWWLTEMISDCQKEFEEVSSIPNSVAYLEGNDMPYGCYDDDGEHGFITFKKDGCTFYVLASDFIACDGSDDIPQAVALRDGVKKILECRCMNKTQKINAISDLFDF